jgi:hypothetical protein
MSGALSRKFLGFTQATVLSNPRARPSRGLVAGFPCFGCSAGGWGARGRAVRHCAPSLAKRAAARRKSPDFIQATVLGRNATVKPINPIASRSRSK